MTAKKRLWIGGSSGLTETYLNNITDHAEWTLLGLDSKTPSWIPSTCQFISCDLTQPTQLPSAIHRIPKDITEIVVGLRPPLVSHRTNAQASKYNDKLLQGLEQLLASLLLQLSAPHVTLIHVSSIAAIDHLAGQHLVSDVTAPRSSELSQPYDHFKRKTEEIIEKLAVSFPSLSATSIRLGAIFSDAPTCIQCSALGLQAWIGPFLQTPIDCNSSRNVCELLSMALSKSKLRPYYFYTRPLLYKQPVPYGQFLVDYRKAYGMEQYAIWIPTFIVTTFVLCFHLLTTIFPIAPYMQSVDYLLQVTLEEHSFDMSAVQLDFPELLDKEETIEACFRRRRKLLSRETKKEN